MLLKCLSNVVRWVAGCGRLEIEISQPFTIGIIEVLFEDNKNDVIGALKIQRTS